MRDSPKARIRQENEGVAAGSANGSRPSIRIVGDPVRADRSASARSAITRVRVVKPVVFSPVSSRACRSRSSASCW
ncbi:MULTISPECIES: hypothetical protein [unclassified Streptomyces]|uniref:hypothetical protein n=1 Tax=unclassified Streptomyces TaxID=2593676 RepID=UPI0018FEC5EE|nr:MULTISPECIES: hypothetical protein [unclassified Streptomyces]